MQELEQRKIGNEDGEENEKKQNKVRRVFDLRGMLMRISLYWTEDVLDNPKLREEGCPVSRQRRLASETRKKWDFETIFRASVASK